MTPPVALSIAGSDSSGGAGIQADLRTFAAHGVHGATAIAALTAQNTVGVQGVQLTEPGFLAAQIDSVLADLDVAATKTGMLGSTGNVETVAAYAAEGRLPALVVDPVMVASTGARLLEPEAENAYRDALIPAATVVTPNRLEAAVLVGRDLPTVAAMSDAAVELVALGPAAVVVKGGDAEDEGDESIDVVAYSDGSTRRLRAPRVATGNDHGTGCSFASAIAAGLALGSELDAALDAAKAFVHAGLAGAAGWRIGAGHGPIDHLGWSGRGADHSDHNPPNRGDP